MSSGLSTPTSSAVYAKKSTDFEFSVTNQVVQKERFRYFIKVPELANFYAEITDYKTAEDALFPGLSPYCWSISRMSSDILFE